MSSQNDKEEDEDLSMRGQEVNDLQDSGQHRSTQQHKLETQGQPHRHSKEVNPTEELAQAQRVKKTYQQRQLLPQVLPQRQEKQLSRQQSREEYLVEKQAFAQEEIAMQFRVTGPPAAASIHDEGGTYNTRNKPVQYSNSFDDTAAAQPASVHAEAAATTGENTSMAGAAAGMRARPVVSLVPRVHNEERCWSSMLYVEGRVAVGKEQRVHNTERKKVINVAATIQASHTNDAHAKVEEEMQEGKRTRKDALSTNAPTKSQGTEKISKLQPNHTPANERELDTSQYKRQDDSVQQQGLVQEENQQQQEDHELRQRHSVEQQHFKTEHTHLQLGQRAAHEETRKPHCDESLSEHARHESGQHVEEQQRRGETLPQRMSLAKQKQRQVQHEQVSVMVRSTHCITRGICEVKLPKTSSESSTTVVLSVRDAAAGDPIRGFSRQSIRSHCTTGRQGGTTAAENGRGINPITGESELVAGAVEETAAVSKNPRITDTSVNLCAAACEIAAGEKGKPLADRSSSTFHSPGANRNDPSCPREGNTGAIPAEETDRASLGLSAVDHQEPHKGRTDFSTRPFSAKQILLGSTRPSCLVAEKQEMKEEKRRVCVSAGSTVIDQPRAAVSIHLEKPTTITQSYETLEKIEVATAGISTSKARQVETPKHLKECMVARCTEKREHTDWTLSSDVHIEAGGVPEEATAIARDDGIISRSTHAVSSMTVKGKATPQSPYSMLAEPGSSPVQLSPTWQMSTMSRACPVSSPPVAALCIQTISKSRRTRETTTPREVEVTPSTLLMPDGRMPFCNKGSTADTAVRHERRTPRNGANATEVTTAAKVTIAAAGAVALAAALTAAAAVKLVSPLRSPSPDELAVASRRDGLRRLISSTSAALSPASGDADIPAGTSPAHEVTAAVNTLAATFPAHDGTVGVIKAPAGTSLAQIMTYNPYENLTEVMTSPEATLAGGSQALSEERSSQIGTLRGRPRNATVRKEKGEPPRALATRKGVVALAELPTNTVYRSPQPPNQPQAAQEQQTDKTTIGVAAGAVTLSRHKDSEVTLPEIVAGVQTTYDGHLGEGGITHDNDNVDISKRPSVTAGLQQSHEEQWQHLLPKQVIPNQGFLSNAREAAVNARGMKLDKEEEVARAHLDRCRAEETCRRKQLSFEKGVSKTISFERSAVAAIAPQRARLSTRRRRKEQLNAQRRGLATNMEIHRQRPPSSRPCKKPGFRFSSAATIRQEECRSGTGDAVASMTEEATAAVDVVAGHDDNGSITVAGTVEVAANAVVEKISALFSPSPSCNLTPLSICASAKPATAIDAPSSTQEPKLANIGLEVGAAASADCSAAASPSPCQSSLVSSSRLLQAGRSRHLAAVKFVNKVQDAAAASTPGSRISTENVSADVVGVPSHTRETQPRMGIADPAKASPNQSATRPEGLDKFEFVQEESRPQDTPTILQEKEAAASSPAAKQSTAEVTATEAAAPSSERENKLGRNKSGDETIPAISLQSHAKVTKNALEEAETRSDGGSLEDTGRDPPESATFSLGAALPIVRNEPRAPPSAAATEGVPPEAEQAATASGAPTTAALQKSKEINHMDSALQQYFHQPTLYKQESSPQLNPSPEQFIQLHSDGNEWEERATKCEGNIELERGEEQSPRRLWISGSDKERSSGVSPTPPHRFKIPEHHVKHKYKKEVRYQSRAASQYQHLAQQHEDVGTSQLKELERSQHQQRDTASHNEKGLVHAVNPVTPASSLSLSSNGSFHPPNATTCSPCISSPVKKSPAQAKIQSPSLSVAFWNTAKCPTLKLTTDGSAISHRCLKEIPASSSSRKLRGAKMARQSRNSEEQQGKQSQQSVGAFSKQFHCLNPQQATRHIGNTSDSKIDGEIAGEGRTDVKTLSCMSIPTAAALIDQFGNVDGLRAFMVTQQPTQKKMCVPASLSAACREEVRNAAAYEQQAGLGYKLQQQKLQRQSEEGKRAPQNLTRHDEEKQPRSNVQTAGDVLPDPDGEDDDVDATWKLLECMLHLQQESQAKNVKKAVQGQTRVLQHQDEKQKTFTHLATQEKLPHLQHKQQNGDSKISGVSFRLSADAWCSGEGVLPFTSSKPAEIHRDTGREMRKEEALAFVELCCHTATHRLLQTAAPRTVGEKKRQASVFTSAAKHDALRTRPGVNDSIMDDNTTHASYQSTSILSSGPRPCTSDNINQRNVSFQTTTGKKEASVGIVVSSEKTQHIGSLYASSGTLTIYNKERTNDTEKENLATEQLSSSSAVVRIISGPDNKDSTTAPSPAEKRWPTEKIFFAGTGLAVAAYDSIGNINRKNIKSVTGSDTDGSFGSLHHQQWNVEKTASRKSIPRAAAAPLAASVHLPLTHVAPAAANLEGTNPALLQQEQQQQLHQLLRLSHEEHTRHEAFERPSQPRHKEPISYIHLHITSPRSRHSQMQHHCISVPLLQLQQQYPQMASERPSKAIPGHVGGSSRREQQQIGTALTTLQQQQHHFANALERVCYPGENTQVQQHLPQNHGIQQQQKQPQQQVGSLYYQNSKAQHQQQRDSHSKTKESVAVVGGGWKSTWSSLIESLFPSRSTTPCHPAAGDEETDSRTNAGEVIEKKRDVNTNCDAVVEKDFYKENYRNSLNAMASSRLLAAPASRITPAASIAASQRDRVAAKANTTTVPAERGTGTETGAAGAVKEADGKRPFLSDHWRIDALEELVPQRIESSSSCTASPTKRHLSDFRAAGVARPHDVKRRHKVNLEQRDILHETNTPPEKGKLYMSEDFPHAGGIQRVLTEHILQAHAASAAGRATKYMCGAARGEDENLVTSGVAAVAHSSSSSLLVSPAPTSLRCLPSSTPPASSIAAAVTAYHSPEATLQPQSLVQHQCINTYAGFDGNFSSKRQREEREVLTLLPNQRNPGGAWPAAADLAASGSRTAGGSPYATSTNLNTTLKPCQKEHYSYNKARAPAERAGSGYKVPDQQQKGLVAAGESLFRSWFSRIFCTPPLSPENMKTSITAAEQPGSEKEQSQQKFLSLEKELKGEDVTVFDLPPGEMIAIQQQHLKRCQEKQQRREQQQQRREQPQHRRHLQQCEQQQQSLVGSLMLGQLLLGDDSHKRIAADRGEENRGENGGLHGASSAHLLSENSLQNISKHRNTQEDQSFLMNSCSSVSQTALHQLTPVKQDDSKRKQQRKEKKGKNDTADVNSYSSIRDNNETDVMVNERVCSDKQQETLKAQEVQTQQLTEERHIWQQQQQQHPGGEVYQLQESKLLQQHNEKQEEKDYMFALELQEQLNREGVNSDEGQEPVDTVGSHSNKNVSVTLSDVKEDSCVVRKDSTSWAGSISLASKEAELRERSQQLQRQSKVQQQHFQQLQQQQEQMLQHAREWEVRHRYSYFPEESARRRDVVVDRISAAAGANASACRLSARQTMPHEENAFTLRQQQQQRENGQNPSMVLLQRQEDLYSWQQQQHLQRMQQILPPIKQHSCLQEEEARQQQQHGKKSSNPLAQMQREVMRDLDRYQHQSEQHHLKNQQQHLQQRMQDIQQHQQLKVCLQKQEQQQPQHLFGSQYEMEHYKNSTLPFPWNVGKQEARQQHQCQSPSAASVAALLSATLPRESVALRRCRPEIKLDLWRKKKHKRISPQKKQTCESSEATNNRASDSSRRRTTMLGQYEGRNVEEERKVRSSSSAGCKRPVRVTELQQSQRFLHHQQQVPQQEKKNLQYHPLIHLEQAQQLQWQQHQLHQEQQVMQARRSSGELCTESETSERMKVEEENIAAASTKRGARRSDSYSHGKSAGYRGERRARHHSANALIGTRGRSHQPLHILQQQQLQEKQSYTGRNLMNWQEQQLQKEKEEKQWVHQLHQTSRKALQEYQGDEKIQQWLNHQHQMSDQVLQQQREEEGKQQLLHRMQLASVQQQQDETSEQDFVFGSIQCEDPRQLWNVCDRQRRSRDATMLSAAASRKRFTSQNEDESERRSTRKRLLKAARAASVVGASAAVAGFSAAVQTMRATLHRAKEEAVKRRSRSRLISKKEKYGGQSRSRRSTTPSRADESGRMGFRWHSAVKEEEGKGRKAQETVPWNTMEKSCQQKNLSEQHRRFQQYSEFERSRNKRRSRPRITSARGPHGFAEICEDIAIERRQEDGGGSVRKMRTSSRPLPSSRYDRGNVGGGALNTSRTEYISSSKDRRRCAEFFPPGGEGERMPSAAVNKSVPQAFIGSAPPVKAQNSNEKQSFSSIIHQQQKLPPARRNEQNLYFSYGRLTPQEEKGEAEEAPVAFTVAHPITELRHTKNQTHLGTGYIPNEIEHRRREMRYLLQHQPASAETLATPKRGTANAAMVESSGHLGITGREEHAVAPVFAAAVGKATTPKEPAAPEEAGTVNRAALAEATLAVEVFAAAVDKPIAKEEGEAPPTLTGVATEAYREGETIFGKDLDGGEGRDFERLWRGTGLTAEAAPTSEAENAAA